MNHECESRMWVVNGSSQMGSRMWVANGSQEMGVAKWGREWES